MRRLTERQIVEFALTRPRTDDELWNYIRVLFNISIPRKAVLPGCSAPFTAFAEAFFCRAPVSIWIGARGTGKTVMLALLASVELLTQKCNISILAGSKDQAELTLKYLRNEDTNLAGMMWGADNAPRMLMDETMEAKGLVKTIAGLTGRREDPGLFIKAHAASETSIRGNHSSKIRYDECIAGDTLVNTHTGKQRIDSLLPGTLVWGWNGSGFSLFPIKALLPKGIRKTLRLEFSNGSVLEVTSNHPLLTKDGWKYAEETQPGEVCCAMLGMREDARLFEQRYGNRLLSGMSFEETCRRRQQMQRLREEIIFQRSAMLRLQNQAYSRSQKNVSHVWRPETNSITELQEVQGFETSRKCSQVSSVWSHGETPHTRTLSSMFCGIPEIRRMAREKSPGLFDTLKRRSDFSKITVGRGGSSNLDWTEDPVRATVCLRPIHSGLLSPCIQSSVGSSGHLQSRRQDYKADAGSYQVISSGWSATYFLVDPFQCPENVERNSSRSNTAYRPGEVTLLSKTEGEDREVYDLHVPHSHTFVCEDILVHNCDLAEWQSIESARGVSSAIRDVDTQTLYCSTYHVYGGTMSKLLAEAREKGWPVHTWTWREVMESNGGFMSQKFIDNKRAELSAAQWELEYENAGPQGGVRVFDKHQLATMFQKRMGVHTGAENDPWKLYPDGVSGGRFYHGADWARDLHWTVVDTLQRTAAGYQRAAWYRTNQKPYPQIIREVVKHVKEYRGPICHDATGVGKAMDDLLVDAGLRRNSVFPIEWTRKKLIREMATLYQHAIENEEIVGPMINFAYSEHEYLTEEMLRGDDHCPDSVAAGMAAYYVARQMCGGRNTVVMRV